MSAPVWHEGLPWCVGVECLAQAVQCGFRTASSLVLVAEDVLWECVPLYDSCLFLLVMIGSHRQGVRVGVAWLRGLVVCADGCLQSSYKPCSWWCLSRLMCLARGSIYGQVVTSSWSLFVSVHSTHVLVLPAEWLPLLWWIWLWIWLLCGDLSLIMYLGALWCACFFMHRMVSWSMPSIALMTLAKIGPSLKRLCSLTVSGVSVVERRNMLWVSPVFVSQSSEIVHSLPLPSSWFDPLLALLSPSATTFNLLGMCHMLLSGEQVCHPSIKHEWQLACHSIGGPRALGSPFLSLWGNPMWCLQTCLAQISAQQILGKTVCTSFLFSMSFLMWRLLGVVSILSCCLGGCTRTVGLVLHWMRLVICP